MGKKELKLVKVGMFVVITLVVAFFMIFMVGSDKNIFESHYKLKGTFTDISGLRIGAPVQLAGIKVGYVDDIRFSKNLFNKKIEVHFSIAEKYAERIREDSVATISTQGLLGDKFIFVSVGSPDEPVLKNDDVIQTKETVGLFELAAKGGDLMDDIHEAAKTIGDLMSDLTEGEDTIKESLKSVRNILREVEKGHGFIHALIYDPQGQKLVEDAASAMDSLKIILGDTGKGDKTRKKIKNVAENINEVANNLRKITNKIDQGQGTIGGLINDPSIYNDIRSLFGKVNRNILFKSVVRTTLKENEKEVLK